MQRYQNVLMIKFLRQQDIPSLAAYVFMQYYANVSFKSLLAKLKAKCKLHRICSSIMKNVCNYVNAVR